MALTQIKASNITDGTVVAAEIAADAIVADKIADDAVVADKIATNAVTNVKIASGVDAAKVTTGTLPMARLSGTLPALNGSALTGLPAGGDKRNFIIDGGLTQWPAYASTDAYPGRYVSTFWYARPDIGTVVFSRDTDVPTVAQSGYKSAYSLKANCTATGSVGSGTKVKLHYNITGNDFAFIHKQAFVFSFWVKSYQTGTHIVSFQNSGRTRAYVAEYTISASATWERKEIAVPAESSDSGWLFTEADVGMRVQFSLASGSTFNTTAGSWTTGHYNGSSNNQNIASNTNNYMNFAQMMITLGTTAPTTLVTDSISTIKKQVAWYFQNEAEADVAYKWAGHGGITSSSTMACKVQYSGGAMRVIPTITSSAANTWTASDHNTGNTVTAISFAGTGKDKTLVNITYGYTGWGIGNYGYFNRTNVSATYLYLDARHGGNET